MYVSDNYGSKWVKGIINWFRSKTLEGIQYDTLIIEATLECGLRRNKLIELVNEYVETGLIFVDGDKNVYWYNRELKPSINIVKERKEITKDVDKRSIEEYNAYVKQLHEIGEKPLSMKEWFVEVNKENG